MNFVESLSLSSGLKINKPFIDELYFPIPSEKYITFCTEDHQSKQWDHFQECIDILTPILKKHNIDIIEIGENKQKYNNVMSVKGVTNANQWAYIIKKSIGHLGPENFMSQLCSLFNIPFVALFSNTDPEYAAPIWSKDASRQAFLTPNLKNWKTSFSDQENPKSINTISAESVAHEILNILGIENSLSNFKVFYSGAHYHQKLIEVIPDFIPQDNFFPRALLNIRMDYHFNQQALPNFASNRKIAIISDREVDLNLVNQLKPSIEMFILKVDETSSEEYVNKLKSLKIKLTLVAKKGSSLASVRLKFFDFKVEEEKKKTKKDLDNIEDLCDTTRYKSSKYIFSKDGKFSSKSSYDKGIKSHNNQLIINDDLFWEESDHYKLYNLKKDDKRKNR